jgi:hypothetical protein
LYDYWLVKTYISKDYLSKPNQDEMFSILCGRRYLKEDNAIQEEEAQTELLDIDTRVLSCTHLSYIYSNKMNFTKCSFYISIPTYSYGALSHNTSRIALHDTR